MFLLRLASVPSGWGGTHPESQGMSEQHGAIEIACRDCGGTNVSRDAWANWSVERQRWELGNVFDDGFCHTCDEEARLIERPVGLERRAVDLG